MVDKIISFIPLICVLIIVGLVIGVVFYVRNKLRMLSRNIFGTESLVEGYNRQKDRLSVEPKSVSGMTRLLEPQIRSDFPDFNWEQFKAKAENMLRSVFVSIDTGNIDKLCEASNDIRDQVRNKIEMNASEGISEYFENVTIHQTEITRYEKAGGKCIITFQSAIGYKHYAEKNGIVTDGDKDRLTQTKYNVELMYIQDITKVTGEAVGVRCPNCGAPITNLGAKFCEYCGGAVIPVDVKVWTLSKYYEAVRQSI